MKDMTDKQTLVVIGNGMVGHHLLASLATAGASERYDVVVFAEEPRFAYDRVNLSKFFDGTTADALCMAKPKQYEEAGFEVVLGDAAVAIDRGESQVRTASGRVVGYDKLVLATGSYPFVPPIEGAKGEKCFVYRTIEDLEAISACGAAAKTGAVVGGGLLGLEAANALRNMGLAAHVVEFAPRLMPLQVDEVGGVILQKHITDLGVQVHTSKVTQRIEDLDAGGKRMVFAEGEPLDVDMIVFSAGIRARDELFRAAELEVGPRGGAVVDESCRTSDPKIFAIGECASISGRCLGLVAPGYRMAEAVSDTLMGKEARLPDFDLSTKLKLMGVDVASFGDAFAKTEGSQAVSLFDSVNGVYKKLVVDAERTRILGGMLVGDASDYGTLQAMCSSEASLKGRIEDLLVPPSADGGQSAEGPVELPDSVNICSCHNVTKGAICDAIRDQSLTTLGEVKSTTLAGTGCGSCVTLVTDILQTELKKLGNDVKSVLCEHFEYTRQELFHIVKVQKIKTFEELIAKVGTGDGCEICKPAVASILASVWNDYILEPEHRGLQDTNDRYLANIQKDGTYSVVPRVAGGEITPDKLIVLGQVAKKYGLYTKITGGQRVDLFGARLDQLPTIWEELIAAGFESGHAYGKALRTVKSCVGSTWCRYGVQDSVGLAIRLENRYKGLRSPHKLKSGVSGCARECSEAQGKDFGIIATEKGYNLYVCGNGGMKPRHADLLAQDLDEPTLIKFIDRFLMFYVRTADRLQRTSTWLDKLEGGIDYLRAVVVDDSLGLAEELEADMAHVVETYQCEWKTTVEDPNKLKMFRAFVNTPVSDPSVVFMPERDQVRPARWDEKQSVVMRAEKGGRTIVRLALVE